MNTLTEALDIFKDNFDDIKQACIDNIQYIVESHPRVVVKDKTEQWVRDKVRYLTIEKEIAYPLRVIKRIKMMQAPKRPGQITDNDIQRAKEYPIEEILGTRTYRIGGRWKFKTLCPLHNEKTPSFCVDKNNRYKCFGCDEQGDSIDLFMKINNTNFINAVKQLS